jgi:hypothetical protein
MANIHKETQEQPSGKSQIDDIEEELIIYDNDFLMSSTDRICEQCGSDHSYKPNSERVSTSIDIIRELLQRKNSNSKEKIQEAIK